MSDSLKQLFEEGWYNELSDFLHSPTFRNIGMTLRSLSSQKVEITPNFKDTFRAFELCSFKNLNTVILGLDPYPGKISNNLYEADGLAFSSKYAKVCPKSLQYIFRALDSSIFKGLGYYPENFDLSHWAKQGILLLNCALTFPIGQKAGAHVHLWKPFILKVIDIICKNKENVCFALFGNVAKEYESYIKNETFKIIKVSHPSSANYQKANKWAHEDVFLKITEFHKNQNIQILW